MLQGVVDENKYLLAAANSTVTSTPSGTGPNIGVTLASWTIIWPPLPSVNRRESARYKFMCPFPYERVITAG